MQVNITLCIQMIHFAIAYYFLKTYVFCPALSILKQEDKQRAAVQDEVDTYDAKHDELREYKQSRWKALQKKLQAVIPSVSLIPRNISCHIKDVKPDDSHVALSKEETEDIVQKLTDTISGESDV